MTWYLRVKKIVILAGLLTCQTEKAGLAANPPRPRLGMNLAAPADWSTELPFVDVFHSSRPWVGQKQGAKWGQGPKLDLDERGWVRRLEPDCWAETLLCNIQGGHYPAGEYVVLYDGRGTIEFRGAASNPISRRPGRMVVRVNPVKGALFLQLRATDPLDPVRNIRVLMPGHETDYRDDPWNPDFLRRWRGMACLRFMDMMKTNNSTVATWGDRPTVKDASFSQKGIPAELLIDLANRLGADPWFCMPHQADDEYVRNFAQLVREGLSPRLKAYVEYSNEVWNSGFRQCAYTGKRGMELGLSDNSREAGWRYTARRSAEIFAIWGTALGRDRLVRVLPSQAANWRVSEEIASFEGAAERADVLAIAPYLTMNISTKGDPPAAEVAGWSVDRLLDHVERKSLPLAENWIQKNKAVADRHGLKLVAYEGGQHLVGIRAATADERLTTLLHAANSHPRIGKIYAKYFDLWTESGGDLFCNFSSTGRWTKNGSWGLLQYLDEDAARSPKFMATMRWAKSLNQPVAIPGP